MNYVSIDTCDQCGKKMVVVNQAVGFNQMVALCTHCAEGCRASIHDQKALESHYHINASMTIGVRITATPFEL